MKQVIMLLLFIIAGILQATAQQKSCAVFKTGQFLIRDKELGNVHIDRDNKFQYEYLPGSAKSLKCSVKWVSDCVYTLKPLNRRQARVPVGVKNPEITVTITETFANSYKANVTCNYADVFITFVMERRKE